MPPKPIADRVESEEKLTLEHRLRHLVYISRSQNPEEELVDPVPQPLPEIEYPADPEEEVNILTLLKKSHRPMPILGRSYHVNAGSKSPSMRPCSWPMIKR